MAERNIDKWIMIAATICATAVTCGMIYLGYHWIAAATAAFSVFGA